MVRSSAPLGTECGGGRDSWVCGEGVSSEGGILHTPISQEGCVPTLHPRAAVLRSPLPQTQHLGGRQVP